MKLNFVGDMFEWRGPAPFYFVRVPETEAARIAEVASMVTYLSLIHISEPTRPY